MSVTDIKTEGVITEGAKETLAAMGKDLELGTVERDLGTVTVEIKALHQQAQQMVLSYAIEIGKRLTEAKAMVEHGGWGTYIKEKLGYSQSTANNFMRIYDAYGAEQGSLFGGEAKSQTLGNLTYTQALALLAVPGEEREEFVREHDVEHMSTRELEAAIKERDEARSKAAETADKLEEALQNLTKEEDLNDKLAQELEELKNRPIDVAVEAADPEEVKKAVDAAVAAEREKAKGEADKLSAKLDKAKAERDEAKAALKEAQSQEGAAAAEADAEVEELKRQLAMADPVTAEFKGLFGQASQLVARLLELVEQAPEDKRDNLRAALRALGEQLGTETGEEPQ